MRANISKIKGEWQKCVSVVSEKKLIFQRKGCIDWNRRNL